MPIYAVYGTVTGSKYLGTVEAKNKKEAEEKVWDDEHGVFFVRVRCGDYCMELCKKPEVSEIILLEEKGDKTQ